MFPMYGKTLEDFPERIKGFEIALSDMADADINAGFEWAIRHLGEFPVPVDIRNFAVDATKGNQKHLAEESIRNQRLIEDRIKDERFEETSAEERRKEFAKMLAEAARKASMEPAMRRDSPDPRFAERVVPANIAAAKGPEWEERLRQQAEDMKRQGEDG